MVWDNQSLETQERETRALKQAEEELNLKGKIITPISYLQEGIIL